ncbi:hypothetical protein CEQ90_16755, partial [Lewinellaceae bacterium SD302]
MRVLISIVVYLTTLSFANSQSCTAAFGFGPTDITIEFMDQSTVGPGDQIVSWSWDFDDGTGSSQQNPTHTFPEADRYDVVLEITTQNGCNSEIEIRIETCVLSTSLNVGDCNAAGDVPVMVTINDVYDNADEIFVSLDGTEVPGSPFEIDEESPVSLNLIVPGDGLEHQLTILSDDIETCGTELFFNVPDCSSDCFLSSFEVSPAGGGVHNVNVGGDFFSPEQITIEVGDLVRWSWIDGGHTTTSDATSGPDSWNSGLRGNGATFEVNITNPGLHRYYCIPHGGPNGAGMSGQIVANCPSSGNFTLDLTFNTSQANAQGYNILVDGQVQPGGPFSYSGTGMQSNQISIAGDGVIHSIVIRDVADPTCDVERMYQAPDCGAAPTCQLEVEASENGGCNPSNEVELLITINAVNPGNNGYQLRLDGSLLGTFPYGGATTTQVINVAGDGQLHLIEVRDVEDAACTATTTITTTDCSIPCGLSNLSASTGGGTVHQVEVRDFDFLPEQITIASGDRVEWVWTGEVAHTATSDATSGADSWDSGLLGQGATYLSPELSAGVHPYYCVPHGAPGGVGMSGTVTVQADCDNGSVAVNLSFNSAGTGVNGYEVLVDGQMAGTFSYSGTGNESATVLVAGDGQSHTIVVRDADDTTCSASTTVTTPDCNAPTCQFSNLTATETGGCQGNQSVSVTVSFAQSGGSAGGYQLRLDGGLIGTYPYAGATTTQTIDVAGDGQPHLIEVRDVEDAACTATTTITTTDCSIPCGLTNLTASTGGGTVHQVEVRDFDFLPEQITIASGDRVEWVWTGAVAHTA